MAKLGLGTQYFEAFGVYDEIEKICKSTKSSTTFRSCLQFVEDLVGSNEPLASLSPRCIAFVDAAMQ
jgi:hypothetical protein